MLITTDKITKSFRFGSGQVAALSDISINIRAGEFTAIVGPSGSGKTTLLNLIGCLDKPDDGSILFQNKDITKLTRDELSRERLKNIGFIFQDYNLIPTLTALENVEYVLWLQGVDGKSRTSRAKETLERVGLGSFLHRRPNALSRGQQQRVAVSRAIVHRPIMVLGDELTANLDHKTGMSLMEFLKELNREEKITFLFATHDPAMMDYASRVIRLQDGGIVSDETH